MCISRLITFLTFLSLSISSALADDYIVVGNNSHLYDEPNMKSATTRNFADEEVKLNPGMAFKITDKTSGWSQIMYTPGIRAYILDTTLIGNDHLRKPEPGNYKMSNSDSKASVTKNNDAWTITVGSDKFNGKEYGKIIVFTDGNGNQRFSLVNIDGKVELYDYDNNLTKFF